MKWLLGLWLLAGLAAAADARPGGGHSFSGGGGGGGRSYSGSRSSSGGGGGAMDAETFVLVLAGFFLVAVIASSVERRNQSTYTSTTTPSPVKAVDVERVRANDPAFSRIAFEDFAFRLYAEAHRARGKPERLAALTPYFTQEILDAFARAGTVDAVVIGSLHITSITSPSPVLARQILDMHITANLASAAGTLAVTERWLFTREVGVTSRPPEKTRTLPCPNCNAPFTRGSSPRTCAHCNTDIQIGSFDWTVVSTNTTVATSVGTTLTGTVAEVGTDLITKVDPTVYDTMMALTAADKNVTWDTVQARLAMIYVRLNAAWNAHDLSLVRGLVSSSLLGYLQFWIDEYKRQHLHNKLEAAKIERFALTKIERDAYFDAITIRVFADGFDYTTDASGKVVGGSQSNRRAYSEYWTLIRSSARRGPVNAAPNCPNCGAPLQISDAGACTHCNAEVENGNFDWVLSKIEQDEMYVG